MPNSEFGIKSNVITNDFFQFRIPHSEIRISYRSSIPTSSLPLPRFSSTIG